MRVTRPSELEIALAQAFAAPRPLVFEALTRPEHLVHWLGTKDMVLVDCAVDLRVGGALRYVFRRPSGVELEVRGVFTEVDPPRRLAYTETYGFSPLAVQVATTLEQAGGQTLFAQTLGYRSREERDGDFEPIATSAPESYAALERYLARGQP